MEINKWPEFWQYEIFGEKRYKQLAEPREGGVILARNRNDTTDVEIAKYRDVGPGYWSGVKLLDYYDQATPYVGVQVGTMRDSTDTYTLTLQGSNTNEVGGAWRCDYLPDIPDDPAGVTYLSNWASGIDGWTATYGTVSATDSRLILNKSSTAANYAKANKSFAFGTSKTYRIRITALQDLTSCSLYGTVDGTADTLIKSLGGLAANQSVLVDARVVGDTTLLTLYARVSASSITGNLFSADFVYVGTGAYLSKVVDNSGNGLHASPQGVTPVDTAYGKMLSFDGIDDYLMVSYSSKLAPTATIAVSVAASSDSWSTFYGSIVSKTQAGGYNFNTIDIAGSLAWTVNIGGTYYRVSYPLASLATGMHFFTGIYDGSYVRMYVDGDEVGTPLEASGTIGYSYSNALIIGGEAGTASTPEASKFFKGTIGNVYIKSTMTMDEIKAFGRGERLTVGAFDKDISNAWEAGIGNGGLVSGTVAANTWYGVFLVMNDTTSEVDVAISSSLTNPGLAGYTYYRRVGVVKTDANSTINPFVEIGGEFRWRTPIIDRALADFGVTTRITISTTAPPLRRCTYVISAYCPSTSDHYAWVASLNRPDTAPSSTNYVFYLSLAKDRDGFFVDLATDTSSNIYARSSTTTLQLGVITYGWHEDR